MGGAVTVDTAQLREGAEVLSEASDDRPTTETTASDLGSAVAGKAFEKFEQYWPPSRSLLTSSVVAITRALQAAADTHERRDAQDATAFQAVDRAI
ncbi:hypothetical protein AB4Z18_05575 [Leifsonia sp. 2TAF2]|uniref:hypothetical protein n=1 Tax=Leifsonia sp. 2TAF2 TaxID=3233009 RepID=UPI003F98E8FE